jgi:hypothetical protein
MGGSPAVTVTAVTHIHPKVNQKGVETMQHGHEHGHESPKGRHGNKGHDDHRDKEIVIVVNGRKKTVDTKKLTFDELISLGFDDPPTGEFICFTITYRRGHGEKPAGTLIEGEPVRVKDGMIFNVTATDKS